MRQYTVWGDAYTHDGVDRIQDGGAYTHDGVDRIHGNVDTFRGLGLQLSSVGGG